MSSLFSRRRRVLRTAATSAALAVAVLGPASGAFAADATTADSAAGTPAASGHEAPGGASTHTAEQANGGAGEQRPGTGRRPADAPAGENTKDGKTEDGKTKDGKSETAETGAERTEAAKTEAGKRTAGKPAAERTAAGQQAPDRYAGEPVYLGNGHVAVLRNDPAAGGPEAWIRYVGPHWQPGDTYMVRVVGLLDHADRTATIGGMTLRLLDADGAAPRLQVTGPQGTKTYALPRSTKPGVKPGTKPGAKPVSQRKDCTVTERQPIGAGTMAVLTNGPKGPRVAFEGAGDPPEPLPYVLDHAHPQLPESAGFLAKIVDADGARPKLITNMEGGGHPASTTRFPQAPQGCSIPVGKVAGTGTKAAVATDAVATGSAVKAAGGQTRLVPTGAVAAGAEGVGDPDHTLVFAGGALASAGAAGVAVAVLRRRPDAGSRM
ncbi:hypothetical protein ACIQU6_14305 [Streptomyces sp. NPDC090442]|uniref:hypothetical protein n=1 Tax=Streptomyces sp. NPDC090442 TaxID=3365962 RepID=UPI0038256C3E